MKYSLWMNRISQQGLTCKEGGLKKEKKKVPGPIKRMSKTVFGALRLRKTKIYWKQASRGNSNTFISFLRQIKQNCPNKNIGIILDNCSVHKSKKVQNFLKRNQMIKLYFLPPYSPEYNPIERFWKWLKCIAHTKIET